jgi:Trypsin-co-occurring domain 2
MGHALVIMALILATLAVGLLAGKHWSPDRAQGANLTSFVESVKSQLEKVESDRVRNGSPALFKLRDFDLELTVIAKDDTKGTAGVKAEVVTANMEQQLSHEVGQKIVLHMILAPDETITLRP